MKFRFNRGELPPALRQIIQQDVPGVLNLIGIV